MKITEFRVPVPLSVDEFKKGEIYMVAIATLDNLNGSEGIEFLKNEPYDNTDGHLGTSTITGTVVPRDCGRYTLKRYHFSSRVPGFLKAIAPAEAMFLIEECWHSYPHTKTVHVSGYLAKETFRLEIESQHEDGPPTLENAVKLSPAELKQRTVEHVDIRSAAGDPASKTYKAEQDASVFKSKVTGRGPLAPGWEKSGAVKPMITAYKVVRLHVNLFGIGGMVESFAMGIIRQTFANSLSRAFTTVDEWIEKSSADIQALEDEVGRKSNEQLRKAGKLPPLADGGSAASEYAKEGKDGAISSRSAPTTASSASVGSSDAADNGISAGVAGMSIRGPEAAVAGAAGADASATPLAGGAPS